MKADMEEKIPIKENDSNFLRRHGRDMEKTFEQTSYYIEINIRQRKEQQLDSWAIIENPDDRLPFYRLEGAVICPL